MLTQPAAHPYLFAPPQKYRDAAMIELAALHSQPACFVPCHLYFHCLLPPQKYRDAAMIELEALHTLGANDPAQAQHCVRLFEWFDYR